METITENAKEQNPVEGRGQRSEVRDQRSEVRGRVEGRVLNDPEIMRQT